MDLKDWQSRLYKHFEQLREDRLAIESNQSIFGLEHGLNQEELKDLFNAIRGHILKRAPSWDHRLPWIVYASEFGYKYSGDEYWQTFEKRTQGWLENGERSWIRDCFEWFHNQLGGVKPSGTWANHFSIICWPITNAILPYDLQKQLAKILYELRHSFSKDLFESPLKFGEFIKSRSWNASSRFRNLVEEVSLIGQISIALLFKGGYGAGKLLHPETLKRISADLDRQRRGREWLRSAQKYAKERMHIGGFSSGGNHQSISTFRPEQVRKEIVELGIEPRIILRPTNSQRDSWDILMEIPDLTHLLIKFPSFRAILKNSRFVVTGSSGRYQASDSLLCGGLRVRMIKWPKSDDLLLQFDHTDEQLEYLLRAECMLRPGPIWLFRIASDGLAYQMKSLNVQPGEKYIILMAQPNLRLGPCCKQIDLSCEDINGMLIELPSALSKNWEDELKKIGLTQIKTIDVWPAGLAAAVWDGEGYGEWLASEQPCLAFHSDYQFDSLWVTLGKGIDTSVEVTPSTPGEVIFIELPQLPVGFHKVHVATRKEKSGVYIPLGDINVMLRIREARSWSPGINQSGPFFVQFNPTTPTLEQIWEGKVDVELNGPKGHQVKSTIKLFERENNNPLINKTLPVLELPVSSSEWKDHFYKYFRQVKEVNGIYDKSRFCEIEFKADELGTFHIDAEREFTPIRWIINRNGKKQSAVLLDDSGSSTLPKIGYYTFEKPSIEKKIDQTSGAFEIPSEGGLYTAQKGNYTSSIIISPEVHGLSNLKCTPQLNKCDHSLGTVINLLNLSTLWSEARLTGDLSSSLRQRDVLHAITQLILKIICGDSWGKTEDLVLKEEMSLSELNRLISKKPEEIKLAGILSKEYEALSGVPCHERVSALSSLGIKYLCLKRANSKIKISGAKVIRLVPDKISIDENPEWLCELTLRIASDPANVRKWAGENLNFGISWILEKPVLARASRYLVIAIHKYLSNMAPLDQLYGGWDWK